MGMGRYLVEAHLREGRPVAELAETHGVHRSWIYKLLARYRQEGETGLEPRSRRPKTSPAAVPTAFEDEIVLLRKQLSEEGLDAGAVTIHWHLARRHDTVPPKPDPKRQCPTPTSESATTASTRPAASPCDTKAGCDTSASGEPTNTSASCSSSPTATCESSTNTANSSANWSSTPHATTSPAARPDLYDVARHQSPMTRDITGRPRQDSNLRHTV